MRAAKIIMAILGVLIVFGFVVVAVEVSNRLSGLAKKRDPLAGVEEVSLPAGASVQGMVPVMDRMYLHVRLPDGGDQVYVVDGPSGRVLRQVGQPMPSPTASP